ncbi:hypothetical protein VTN49DRAFT_723 [Thermomyces lanuginosus]|uniref:uncharacterized protein n=1 Tax=Thermomyces lanuginosus TaxID=5541 RepID=UPI003742F670
MPRVIIDSDSDSFSETDVSMDRRRVRRRSFSRHRRSSPDRGAFLTPGVSSSLKRSLSTGGRRRVERDPAVVIDVHNEVRGRVDPRDRHDRVGRLLPEEDFYEEDVRVGRSRRRSRVRADSRSPSQNRDWELVVDQRLLERNDLRQDLELARQQREIERLERKLARQREAAQESRKDDRRDDRRDDDRDRRGRKEEEETSRRLREALEELERLKLRRRTEEELHRRTEEEVRKRTEEERRISEYKEKVRRLEEMERKMEEEEKLKRLAREKHLREIEEQERKKAERERIAREIKEEEERKAREEAERKKEIAALKAKAVEEWKAAEEARRIKEQKEKEQKDKEFRERLKQELGLDDEQVEELLNKKNKSKEKEGKNDQLILAPRPEETTTYIKVHRKYLLPETLMAFGLPWDFHPRDPNYLIIKKYISEDLQEELFAHTRRLREGKLVSETSSTNIELRVNDRNKDKMYLVRKKNGPKRLWFLT